MEKSNVTLASNAGFLKKQIEYILKGPFWEVFFSLIFWQLGYLVKPT